MERSVNGAGFSIEVTKHAPESEPCMLPRDHYEIKVARPLTGDETLALMIALKSMLVADCDLSQATVLR